MKKDRLDRLYERLGYPWWLHPLAVVWIYLPAAFALLLWAIMTIAKGVMP